MKQLNSLASGRLIRFALITIVAYMLSACAVDQTKLALSSEQAEIKLMQRALKIHQQSLVLDAHADIALPSTSSIYLAADGLSEVEPKKLQEGGVGAGAMSIAVGAGARTLEGTKLARIEADKKFKAISQLITESKMLALATSAKQIETLHREGKIAIVLGFQNARLLGGNVAVIDEFYDAGVRVFALNHLGHNDFSDSSRPEFDNVTGTFETTEKHGGLSSLGVSAIKRINQLGALVDVSQMSKAGTLQVLELSQTPVIASHSNVRRLSNVSRNLSDQEIDLIGQTGGVVNVVAFAPYLVDFSDPVLLAAIRNVRLAANLPEEYSYPYELYWEIADPRRRQSFLVAMRKVIGTGSVERLVDHVDYIVKRIGIDHVGIASDFNHGGGIQGFSDASEALNITIELLRRGYSADQIEKIWGANFLRVLQKAQSGAKNESEL
jgi:membrane dipeptidase